MTPERWHHIKALLQAALERQPVERNEFLNQACASDPSLRVEVESLIASYELAGGFIESPAFEVMAESLAKDAMAIGSSLGPYQIIERLGAGGMGEVYLAEDKRLGRKVALKVLPAHFTTDKERLRRFQQEARAASALNHPNIITIYEIGQADSRHFIATEFIEGVTLRRHLSGVRVSITDALEMVMQVASALRAAHEAGIVHRDIKPENIMLRADHIIKVLDFGLAKLTEKKAITSEFPTLVETAQGMVMGTAFYMSPEQARGFSVDARTDIWSLGVVLYEMVAGRLPFEGATGSDVIVSILDREPITLVRFLPEIPSELEWIVRKALRKDREERYQTTRELLTDLKGLKRKLEFEEELARSLQTGPKSQGPVSRDHTSSAATSAVPQTAERPRAPVDSVAILPLVNSSADPSLDYFTDGITESMINALSQLPELRVMAWSTVSRYRSQQVDPRSAGRELGVRAIVTGRVMKAGEGFVIKTELVDATDGSHLWGESYSCKPSDILDFEAKISSELSEKLLVRLSSEERKRVARRYTANIEAYHAYLRGRYCWNKRTDEGVRRAIEYFKHAIDSDPGYALAYSGLADSYLVLGSFGIATLSPKDAFPRAREAALRALAIDETLAEAHASLAYALGNFDWDWSASEKEFKRAFELKPSYATAHHWYGFIYLTAQGQLEDGINHARQALELDPLSLPVSSNIGLLLYLDRRYDQAIDQFHKTLEMDQRFVYSHWELALAYEQKGMYKEAITELQTAIALSGKSTLPVSLLGHTYAVAGKRDEALAVLDQLNELSQGTYVSCYRVAAIYCGLGQKDEAFRWLERAYEERDGWLIWLKLDPVMAGLRFDVRFTHLLSKIGLHRHEDSPQIGTTGVLPARTPHKISTEIGIEESKKEGTLLGRSQPQLGWNRRVTRLLLALGLIAVTAILGYLWFGRGLETEVSQSLKNLTFMQLTSQSGPEFFPSLSPDGKSLAYASRSTGNWDIYLQRVGGSNPNNLTRDSLEDDSQPAFSPDGERIAFRSERDGGGIYLMGATGESIIRIADFGYSPSWSPDGAQILVGTEKVPQPSTRPTKSQLWSIDIKSHERRLLFEGDALQPNYSPNKQRITFWSRPNKAGQREEIWTVAIDGGQAVAVTNGSTTDLNPIWAPDGKYLYFSSNRGGSFNVWRVAIDEKTGETTGEAEAVTTVGAATSVLQLAFSKDGRRLAYSAQEEVRNIRRIPFDPSTEKVAAEPISITEGTRQLWFPDPSPDGEWLACYSMGQQRHIFIMRIDGSDQRDLTDDNYRHFWPRWSPDGKRIAFTSRRTGTYELWVIDRDGSNLHQLTSGHQSPGAHYSIWSPDGNRMAYSIHVPKNDCLIFQPNIMWSEQKPEALAPLSDASISFEGWSWSADGKKLAGIKHLPSGIHSGIGLYDLESKAYDWLTDFGDWPLWLADNERLLFVSQGKILLFDTRTRKYHPVLTVTNQDVDIGSPGISRDNRTIYFSFVDTQADIWLMDLPG